MNSTGASNKEIVCALLTEKSLLIIICLLIGFVVGSCASNLFVASRFNLDSDDIYKFIDFIYGNYRSVYVEIVGVILAVVAILITAAIFEIGSYEKRIETFAAQLRDIFGKNRKDETKALSFIGIMKEHKKILYGEDPREKFDKEKNKYVEKMKEYLRLNQKEDSGEYDFALTEMYYAHKRQWERRSALTELFFRTVIHILLLSFFLLIGESFFKANSAFRGIILFSSIISFSSLICYTCKLMRRIIGHVRLYSELFKNTSV